MLSSREFAMFGSSFVIGIGHRQRESVVDELGSAAKAVPHGWVTLSGTLKPSKGLFTSSFWIYNSKKTTRQKSHSWESGLLLSAGIFKATVKCSDRAGCSGISIFPSVTLHCPAGSSCFWLMGCCCCLPGDLLGWDDPTQRIVVTLPCYLTSLFGK